MSTPRSEMISINDARLYVEQAGSGQPVVLLHAGIADSRMWDAQFDAFSADFRVVRYDMRGFGQSTMPPGEYAHVDDLATLLHHLNIARPLLIGASQGGRVALEFALKHPERAAALVLSAPGLRGYDYSDMVAQYAEANDAAAEAGDIDRAVELDMRMWVDGPRRRVENVDPAFRERAYRLARHVYQTNNLDSQERRLTFSMVDHLSRIATPALVLVGEYEVPDFINIAGMVAFTLENARKVMIPGAAHLLPMELPDTFNQHVLAFLKEVAP